MPELVEGRGDLDHRDGDAEIAEFAETKSLTTKHTKEDTKDTKKTERATTRGAGHETKSASQTQTRYGQGLCVCETLYVSLAAGCAGRRRARVWAGFAVSAFKPSSSSCSSWVAGLLTNFVFSWLPFVISIRATAQSSWRSGDRIATRADTLKPSRFNSSRSRQISRSRQS